MTGYIPWGGEGGERMERRLSRRACTERECHTYTDTWSVCVWLGDRMAIHSQRRGVCVCVWQKGKPSCSTGGGGGGGRRGSPSSLARTHSWKTTQPHGWGEGMREEAEHKIAAVGQGDAAEAEGYPVPHRGGGGRIHHDVHYLLKYKSTLQDTMRGGGGGGGRLK